MPWFLDKKFLFSLNTKYLNDKKLNGAIKGTGINFAIFGSIPEVIKALRITVPNDQKRSKLTKYLIPDFEWLTTLLNDQK